MSNRRMMWMGPRGYERWVPAARVKPDFSRVGVREVDIYINGGAGVRGTKEAHREYNFTWEGVKRRDLLPVLDMAEGLYDTETVSDLIYFLDPTVMDLNVLSSMHAAPYKGGMDGIPLLIDKDGFPVPPVVVQTATNALGYPARSAQYQRSANDGTTAIPIYVPIPEGHTLWFGAHGSSGGLKVTATEFNRQQNPLKTTVLDLLAVDTKTQFNYSVSGDSASGVELTISGTGTGVFSGMIAQVLKNGARPLPGGFISGQGAAGCEFASTPTESPYLGGKMLAVTAKMVETEQWR